MREKREKIQEMPEPGDPCEPSKSNLKIKPTYSRHEWGGQDRSSETPLPYYYPLIHLLENKVERRSEGMAWPSGRRGTGRSG